LAAQTASCQRRSHAQVNTLPDIAFASPFAVRPSGFKNSSLRISPNGTGRIPFFFILILNDTTSPIDAREEFQNGRTLFG
jgi:hypothetical protein